LWIIFETTEVTVRTGREKVVERRERERVV
jgi:hypothetical protein